MNGSKTLQILALVVVALVVAGPVAQAQTRQSFPALSHRVLS